MKKIFLIFLILTLASWVCNDVYLCERNERTLTFENLEIDYERIPWYEDKVILEDSTFSMFDTVIPFILKHEGSAFVRDMNINEVSRRGITLDTYRQYYGKGNMNSIRNLTEEQATAIYKKLFWDNNNLDSVVTASLCFGLTFIVCVGCLIFNLIF